jgi:hypothetical protein
VRLCEESLWGVFLGSLCGKSFLGVSVNNLRGNLWLESLRGVSVRSRCGESLCGSRCGESLCGTAGESLWGFAVGSRCGELVLGVAVWSRPGKSLRRVAVASRCGNFPRVPLRPPTFSYVFLAVLRDSPAIPHCFLVFFCKSLACFLRFPCDSRVSS